VHRFRRTDATLPASDRPNRERLLVRAERDLAFVTAGAGRESVVAVFEVSVFRLHPCIGMGATAAAIGTGTTTAVAIGTTSIGIGMSMTIWLPALDPAGHTVCMGPAGVFTWKQVPGPTPSGIVTCICLETGPDPAYSPEWRKLAEDRANGNPDFFFRTMLLQL
jgi:hypothetical protein